MVYMYVTKDVSTHLMWTILWKMSCRAFTKDLLALIPSRCYKNYHMTYNNNCTYIYIIKIKTWVSYCSTFFCFFVFFWGGGGIKRNIVISHRIKEQFLL